MNSRTGFLTSAVLGAGVFAVGFAGTVLVIPGGGDVTDADFTNFYDSSGKRTLAAIFVLTLLAGCWLLVWFFNELRARLPNNILSQTAHGIAMIGVVGAALGGAIMLAPAGVQLNSSKDFVGIPIAHTFAQAGLGGMIFVGMYSFLASTLLFNLVLMRSKLVPTWLVAFGFVATFIMIGSLVALPALIFPIWIVVLGIVGLREQTITAGP